MQQAPAGGTLPKTAPAPGTSKDDIVVSLGRYGIGFVIVQGLDQLRDQLDRNGVADAVLQRSRQPVRLRRNSSGDLIQAE